MAHYSKTYTSPAQLTALLQSRGLHVENVTRTENYLRHIGYYRFSAYLYPLLTTPKENHVFKPGAAFNQALDMYRFDRHLRLLMFNEIEKTTKSTLKKRFPIKKFGRFNKMHYLCTHENPPSLFTMLKSAGRFIFIR